jgi:anti-sigma-K factor RskA
MGTTSPMESQEAEHYIEKYPEVKKTYIELQENLEEYASSFAVPAPAHLKSEILGAIRKKPQRAFPILAVVACGVAILFGLVSYMIYDQNSELLEDRQLTNALIEQLNSDIVSNKETLQSVEEQFMILNNSATKKYVLLGNRRARKLETVAYVNTLEKKSYVHVVSLPKLPDDQVYQMWADVDGVMKPLDILKISKENLVEIPYEERMASFNITIEPKGGSQKSSKDKVVSTVQF